MITLFDTYRGGISGSNTSVIDLYFYLRNKLEVELTYRLSDFNQFKSIINDVQNNFQTDPTNFINRFVRNELKSDIIITSAETLVHMKEYDIRFECNKLILLDTTGLLIAKLNNYIDEHFNLDNRVKCNQIILLGNPGSKQFEKYVDVFVEHYHKFSKERLSFVQNKLTSINKILSTDPSITEDTHIHVAQFKRYFNPSNKIINNCDLTHLFYKPTTLPHSCNSYEYKRWFEVVPTIFIENIGKLIFEFCWLNKPVYYSAQNKSVIDGLYYYLRLFGIDDSYDQIINITKKDIEDKLVYKQDESILELL